MFFAKKAVLLRRFSVNALDKTVKNEYNIRVTKDVDTEEYLVYSEMFRERSRKAESFAQGRRREGRRGVGARESARITCVKGKSCAENSGEIRVVPRAYLCPSRFLGQAFFIFKKQEKTTALSRKGEYR